MILKFRWVIILVQYIISILLQLILCQLCMMHIRLTHTNIKHLKQVLYKHWMQVNRMWIVSKTASMVNTWNCLISACLTSQYPMHWTNNMSAPNMNKSCLRMVARCIGWFCPSFIISAKEAISVYCLFITSLGLLKICSHIFWNFQDCLPMIQGTIHYKLFAINVFWDRKMSRYCRNTSSIHKKSLVY